MPHAGVAVGLLALSALGGVLAGELVGSTNARPQDGVRSAATTVAASDQRAADIREIQAHQAQALVYQAALDTNSPDDPCASLATGAAALARSAHPRHKEAAAAPPFEPETPRSPQPGPPA